MYDRTTVQGATFNMRGQLHRGHANATTPYNITPESNINVMRMEEMITN